MAVTNLTNILILVLLAGLFGDIEGVPVYTSLESRDHLMNVTSDLIAGLPQLIQQLAPAILNTIVEVNSARHTQNVSCVPRESNQIEQ